MCAMDEQGLSRYLTETFSDVETAENLGYRFFFYRDDHNLPFATIALTGNEYEQVSRLDRPGVFRLNLGVSKATFQRLFGAERPRLEAYDFTALDTLMPHPEYAAQSFFCVLNPSPATFEQLRPLLAEAYELAAMRYRRLHPGP